MTGRVLNDAQIKIIERNLPRWSFCGGIATQQVPDLIETIRDRDKTIVALESRLSNWQHEAWDYKHENTILREAYRNQDKFLYHPHCSAYQLSYDGKWRCMTCGKEVVIEVGELK